MEAIYPIGIIIAAFLPTIVGISRKHRSKLAIIAMDLLSIAILGLSAFASISVAWLLGLPFMLIAAFMWLWAMIWSLTGNVVNA